MDLIWNSPHQKGYNELVNKHHLIILCLQFISSLWRSYKIKIKNILDSNHTGFWADFSATDHLQVVNQTLRHRYNVYLCNGLYTMFTLCKGIQQKPIHNFYWLKKTFHSVHHISGEFWLDKVYRKTTWRLFNRSTAKVIKLDLIRRCFRRGGIHQGDSLSPNLSSCLLERMFSAKWNRSKNKASMVIYVKNLLSRFSGDILSWRTPPSSRQLERSKNQWPIYYSV